MNREEFVPYDIALAMKELGFDEPCFGFYSLHDDNKAVGGNYPCNGTNSAPLYQQLFRFFREEHELYGSVGYKDDLKSEWGGSVKGYYEAWGKYDLGFTGWFNTYEEAQDACLRKLISLVKEQK